MYQVRTVGTDGQSELKGKHSQNQYILELPEEQSASSTGSDIES